MMGHIQHLSFESLVKMDHFQKEPPLNLKETTGAKGIGNPGQTECPLWSKADIRAANHVRFTPESRHVQGTSRCPLCARSGHSRPRGD